MLGAESSDRCEALRGERQQREGVPFLPVKVCGHRVAIGGDIYESIAQQFTAPFLQT